jgi:hypothetical protein
MSKFRDTPSQAVATQSRDAYAELTQRLKYQVLQRVLAVIDTLEAAPSDCGSRLRSVEDASRLFIDVDETDEEGDEDEDDDQ